MGAQGRVGKSDGGRLSVADPAKEREAWKEHFKKVSLTRGEVPPHVWDNIPETANIATW